MKEIRLSFANASCAHCANLVSRSLRGVDGVEDVRIDRDELRVCVHFDPSLLSSDSIRKMMERSGYPTRVVASRPALSTLRPPLSRAA